KMTENKARPPHPLSEKIYRQYAFRRVFQGKEKRLYYQILNSICICSMGVKLTEKNNMAGFIVDHSIHTGGLWQYVCTGGKRDFPVSGFRTPQGN
ncbi:MAG: hypothetical protein M1543_03395, partial [Firmicutes bacterium]|nr:hypothetical protein [Bacillota bacterium]